jgi:hypothetical protein
LGTVMQLIHWSMPQAPNNLTRRVREVNRRSLKFVLEYGIVRRIMTLVALNNNNNNNNNNNSDNNSYSM